MYIVKLLFKNLMNNKFITTIINVVSRVDIITASSSIAYFGLLSLFPSIVILSTILPYLGLTIDTALNYVQTAVPESVFTFLDPIIRSVLSQNGVGALSISIIITLWSLSRVVSAIRVAQNGIYNIQPNNVAIFNRFISMFWLIIIMFIIGILLIIASIGSNILDALPISSQIIYKIESAKRLIVIVGLFIGAFLFNTFLPREKPRFIWNFLGTIIQITLVIWLAKAFGWYINIAARAFSFYQALSSAIILLLWLNFIALSSLVGTIITAILQELFPAHISDRASNWYMIKLFFRNSGKK
ncbi:YihY/virulence factor BrkB family protein [Weissella sagaensis]|uniref:YihY/virulence factor BrkB family protein n=1 Tax=Weissella sagaensis TaxID=2559928 RepID=UPI001EFEF9AA|nr:YihY/virulence factor BrkB family protein [Weissella sagaensis]